MLVKLESSTSGEMIMFAEHARQLFDIVGKEATARGVFTLDQLPEALARLHRAVDEEKAALHAAELKAREAGIIDEAEEDEKNSQAEEDRKAGRIGVTLGQRATPLIHLMEWTLKEKGFILWRAEHDF